MSSTWWDKILHKQKIHWKGRRGQQVFLTCFETFIDLIPAFFFFFQLTIKKAPLDKILVDARFPSCISTPDISQQMTQTQRGESNCLSLKPDIGEVCKRLINTGFLFHYMFGDVLGKIFFAENVININLCHEFIIVIFNNLIYLLAVLGLLAVLRRFFL